MAVISRNRWLSHFYLHTNVFRFILVRDAYLDKIETPNFRRSEYYISVSQKKIELPNKQYTVEIL
jgi:hypothetical protein